MSRLLTAIGRNIWFFIPANVWVFSRQISENRNIPAILPNYFGYLCNVKSLLASTRILCSSGPKSPAVTTRPLSLEFHYKIFVPIQTFCNLSLKNRNWKILCILLNYFRGQKGVLENYLHMVVKINPVNWRKRNQHMAGKKLPAINCFKFGK